MYNNSNKTQVMFTLLDVGTYGVIKISSTESLIISRREGTLTEE